MIGLIMIGLTRVERVWRARARKSAVLDLERKLLIVRRSHENRATSARRGVADCAVVRFVLLVAFLALFSTRAAADDAAEFRELVKQATEAFGRGEFQRAIELADQAYAMKPNPRLLYNRARAHEALGNADKAITDYERYLKEEPETEDRGIVTGRIKALRAQLAERERLAGERDEAASRRASARSHYRRYLELSPQASDRKEIEKRIAELEKPPQKAATRDTPKSSRRGAGPWITLAVGGVALGGGAIFGVLSRDKYDSAKDAGSGREAGELRDDGDRFTTFANAGFILGGVAVVSGLVWYLLESP